METVSKDVRKEIVEALRGRYDRAGCPERGRILTEFAQISGYHRKHAIRLLNGKDQTKRKVAAAPVGRRVYDEAVKSALIMIWEAGDRICGKRLKAMVPTLVASMETWGHLSLEPTVRERLLSVSAATIDRMLKPIRSTAGGRRTHN